MNIHIETDRFILRDIEESDLQGIFDLDSDPEVMKYIGVPPITTFDQARDTIRYIRDQYKSNGIGRWAIIDKKSSEFVGWSGLKYEQELRKEFDYYDIGYRLIRKFWGQGFATATALEALRYGFEKMELKEIGGAAEIEHKVSNHILQKIGLKFTEQFECDGIPCYFYRMTRSDWLKGQ